MQSAEAEEYRFLGICGTSNGIHDHQERKTQKEKRREREGKRKRRERARDGTSESARRAEVAFSLHSYLVSYNPVHAIESGHLHGSAYIMKHRNEQEEV